MNEKKVLDTQIVYQNIILHLKCKASDIESKYHTDGYDNEFKYNPQINDVQPFNENNNFCNIENTSLENKSAMQDSSIPCAANEVEFNDSSMSKIGNIEETTKHDQDNKVNESKIIHQKLSELEQNLHFNTITKKSNCFWCTYDFDNPVIYIPKCIKNDSYEVYGNFCSPECACSYLFNQHIDDTTKFERYQMLNFMYCSIYDYKKNIKLAPNPYYTLEKYMGNLTIQEYRKLLKNERLLILIDKPLTKIFPELHEDNNEFDVGVNTKYILKKSVKANKSDSIEKLFNTS